MTGLAEAARALAVAPADPDAHLAAARAVIAAAGEDGGNDLDARDACLRTLLLQEQCPARPLIFAHEVAHNITSGNDAKVSAVLAGMEPLLQDVLSDPDHPGFRNVVVFLLTARACLGDWISQETLRDLHLSWFARFARDDLALPYSVMFNAPAFGRNRDELLERYWHRPDRSREIAGLRPPHVLLLEWLTGQSAFTAADNGDLLAYLSRHLPGDGEDLAAARTLVLRHLRPGGELGPRLAALGLESVAGLASDAAAGRAAHGDNTPARVGARLLHKRPYQALQAGWSLATSRAPFLNTGQRRVRVAVCVSGQLRGYKAALASWRRTLLAHVDAHFFVHSWQKVGRADAQPFRHTLPFEGQAFTEAYRQAALAEGYDAMRARYPALFTRLFESGLADEAELEALYQTDHVVLDDETAEPFAGFSNQEKMHYKIHAADRLARDAGAFDLHMRIRPDLAIRMGALDWRDIRAACTAGPLLFADGAPGVHYGNLMIGDQCAIAAPEVMDIYAGTWERFPAIAQAGIAGCPDAFTGHVSLAITTWLHGVTVRKVPARFGTLQEATPMALSEIAEALEADSRGDAIDKRLLDAARSGIG